MNKLLTISIVSHEQLVLAKVLLDDIAEYCDPLAIEVILTLNVPEAAESLYQSYAYPLKIIKNQNPKGFGANHNQAFLAAKGTYFCVLNPDVRLLNDPFPDLLATFHDQSVGAVAPLVLGTSGEIEDSARSFPTPLKILCKALGACRAGDYLIKTELIYPDWVAGMCIIFPRSIFHLICGFDERYFLYYEDVDICARLRDIKKFVVLCPSARIIHSAQRTSHYRLKYFKWHLISMLRFFLSPVYLRLRLRDKNDA